MTLPHGYILEKYGQNVSPWVGMIMMDNTENDSVGGWKQGECAIRYSYRLQGNSTMGFGMERDPRRIVNIQNPDQYKGHLGQQGCSQQFEHRVFVVNGYVDKCDGNFHGGFIMQRIADTGIYLGSYPSQDIHFRQIINEGCGAVMNLMTPSDILQRGFNNQMLLQKYQQYNINVIVNFPLNDWDDEQFSDGLFKAAIQLNDLINNKGLKVFVHDSAGMCRGPALIILYICLFLKHPTWQYPNDIANFIKSNYPLSHPNMKVVIQTIENHKDF